jgi:hypothetical protein
MGYRLTIAPAQGGDQYRLSWGDENTELFPYNVSAARVNSASDEVRAVLNQLTRHYRDCEISDQLPDFRPFLQDLAAAGEELCSALFPANSGSQITAKIRTRIERLEGRPSLSIISEGTPLHVPWNFVFRGDPFARPAPTGTFADFKDFWSNVFSISVTFNRLDFFDEPASREHCVLHALHASHFESALNSLPDEEERARVKALLRLEVGVSTDWEDCRHKWRKAEAIDSLVYIFGHSDGKYIYLSQDNQKKYRLDANGFQATFMKSHNVNSNTVCLINGCHTGVGLFGSGFLTVSSMPGFQGFVGSEAELSSLFAIRYGAEFTKRLLAGDCVKDIVETLRLDPRFFPQSFIYTCFAQPRFKFSGAPLGGASKHELPSAVRH